MALIQRNTHHTPRTNVFIYTVVFNSAFTLVLIAMLFISFLIQPIHQAYANEATGEELEGEEISVAAEPVAEHIKESVNENSQPVEESAEAEIVEQSEFAEKATENTVSESSLETVEENDESSATSTQQVNVEPEPLEDLILSTTTDPVLPPPVSTSTPTTTVIVPPIATTSPTTTNLVPTPIASTTATSTGGTGGGQQPTTTPSITPVIVPTSTPSTTDILPPTPIIVPNPEPIGPPNATTTPPEPGEKKPEPGEVEDDLLTPSTTDLIREVVRSIDYLVTEENYYQFSKQSCVPVGDGAFHCSKNSEHVIDSNAVVYSDISVDTMNSEIFIKTSAGKVERITENEYEDSSPHYDAKSKRIVWQRLIEGRYQIILYSIDKEEETQLTFSRTNSMEPAVSAEGVVWQEWDNNDWEVMFFDGTYTEQITDNSTQDLAPVIEDKYVIWTVIGENSQFAQVYSIENSEVVTITNHEGGNIVNPRFVLVYDTQFENGDVVTQKFDPETGFSAPIAAKAAPEPIDIPDTDTTGEIRALIQNKGSSKDGSKVVTGNDGTNDLAITGVGDNTLVVASTSADEINDVAMVTMATTTNDVLELTEFDLIITAEQVAEALGATSVPLEIATSTQE